MSKVIALAGLFLLYPATTYAQSGFSYRFDTNGRTTKILDKSEVFSWQGRELTFEQEWRKNKILLSGFRLGLRKEGRLKEIYDGAYFVFGTFRRLNPGGNDWVFYTELDVIYGLPGVRFNRIWEERDSSGIVKYTRFNLIKNANIPEDKLKANFRRMLVFYPSVSLALRRKLGFFHLDGVLEWRLMRFQTINSDFTNVVVKSEIMPMPSLGVRAGIKF